MKWKSILEMGKLKDTDIICCIQNYKGSIIESDTNTFEWFKNHRKYELKNNYTHFIKLPKI